MSTQRIVVVGAGLSGLAVAARLLAAGREVLVLERSALAGGQIQTVREGGLIVELGAEGFVARSRAVPALCQLLGIEDALADQLTTDTYAIEQDELVLLPPGEAARRLGFQVSDQELGRGIRSLGLGMGQLIDALVDRVSSALRRNVEVAGLHRATDGVVLELADGSRELAGAVVLAAPARLAARLLQPLALAQAAPLAAAPLMSNVSVNLLYAREGIANCPSGSGLLFPDSFANVGLRALSIVDHKFAGRTPAGKSLLRVFFRPVADALTTWADQRFVETAHDAIARVLDARSSPERAWVSRWPEALPVFSPAHQTTASALDHALRALQIHVTGSAFHGAGIDAAACSAETVAARLAR